MGKLSLLNGKGVSGEGDVSGERILIRGGGLCREWPYNSGNTVL